MGWGWFTSIFNWGSPPPPPPPPPDYYCPPDYLRNFDPKESTRNEGACGNSCDEYDVHQTAIIKNTLGTCECACRLDPNSGTAANMILSAHNDNNARQTEYNRYNNIFIAESNFINNIRSKAQSPAVLPTYNNLITVWNQYSSAMTSYNNALTTYKNIAGWTRRSNNPSWINARDTLNNSINTVNSISYPAAKNAYINIKNVEEAAAAEAERLANSTLNGILHTYTREKTNTITTAIENEIANTAQTATTFGVVSQYNNMKSSWNSYKTAYDDIIRSIQTFLNIKEKVSALNEYNKVKDMLAKSISTANSNYNSSKINFNTALKAAQKMARETEWIGINRPGCRNLVSNSTSLNNIECNNNEYIYGFKNTDDSYFYTCCAVPKGIIGTGGLPGFDGPIGPQGARGSQGLKGSQGPQGQQSMIQGPQGVKGEAIRGPKGPPGKKGKQGAPGPRGDSVELRKDIVIKQVVGPSGIKGEVGPRGAQGSQGEKGTIGRKGRKGKDGQDVIEDEDEDKDDNEYISSNFNKGTIQILDLSDIIRNKLS